MVLASESLYVLSYLTPSYQIIKKHHGSLKCQSVPEQGAQFLIGIPILQPQQLLRKPTTS